MKKRVHILTTVNAANVSKASGVFTIASVCGAVDQIVMNGMLYPGEQLAAAAPSLEGKPAPAGHPKNAAGQHISAVNGEALASAWIGSYVRNARHEAGRTLVDVVVNEAQAKAVPAGAALVVRLDAAIAGTNSEPIHVSTGLLCNVINASGESGGRKYARIATDITYDHLAILLDEDGAGTPADGIGMFLNAAGEPEEIEAVQISTEPEDRRSAGLLAWVKRLIGNGAADVSFDTITSALYAQMQEGCWIRDVFDRYAVWSDAAGTLWKQDYAVSSDASVAFAGQAVEVTRKVEYQTITNQETDSMKPQIIAALNAAGIKTEGLDEAQLLTAYNALVTQPVEAKLTAANGKIAANELAAKATADAELDALAKSLAVNTSLTAADFKAMGLARCKELKASASAAPVLPGSGGAADEFAGYSLNSFIEPAKA